MADVPVWYWQVLGALCGLGLGIWLGALRQRRARNPRPGAAPGNVNQGAAPTTLMAPPPSAPAPLGMAVAPSAPMPLQAPAGAGMAAPVPVSSADVRADGAQQRLLQRLRDSNLELTTKLRAATDLHARELLERSQQQQAERQRHERQLEELRQTHSGELANLMSVLVEQVDGIHKTHAAQVKALESEVERLRRGGAAAQDPQPPASNRPVTHAAVAAAAASPVARPHNPTAPVTRR